MWVVLYFVMAYVMGNLMSGYLLVKYFFRDDIRNQGSGNVGARNVGRLYGKSFFLFTFIGDACKGAAVIVVGSYMQVSNELQLIGLGLAIIGHLKPILLRFQGGKGVSTFIGGMLAYDPLIALVLIGSFLVTYPFTKSFTKSGLGSFIVIPIYLLIQSEAIESVILVSVMVFTIIFAHFGNKGVNIDD